MFIVLEGPDAAGKATQVKLLAEWFESQNQLARVYSFPRYATPLGQSILRHLKNEIQLASRIRLTAGEAAPEDALWFQCAMIADKYDAAPEIAGDLAAGFVVIADRWWPSGYAYGGADGVDKQWLETVCASLPEPDLSILLSVPLDETCARRPKPRDRYESDRPKQERVRELYAELWTKMRVRQGGKWAVIAGARSSQNVHTEILSFVRLHQR